MPPTLVPAAGAPAVQFRPAPAQLRLLDQVHETPSFRTIHELCANAGVSRATYYRWCQDADFRLWFAASWAARLMMDGAVQLNIARAMSTRSFPYWKALFDLTFDPKGLNALQQWQQNLARMAPSAFAFAPDPAPQPEPPSVSPMAPSNQPLGTETETDRAPAAPLPPATPLQVARCFHRALSPRRRHRRVNPPLSIRKSGPARVRQRDH